MVGSCCDRQRERARLREASYLLVAGARPILTVLQDGLCVTAVPWVDRRRGIDVPGDDGASQGTLSPPGLHRFIAESHNLADRADSFIGLGVRRGPEVRLMKQGPS